VSIPPDLKTTYLLQHTGIMGNTQRRQAEAQEAKITDAAIASTPTTQGQRWFKPIITFCHTTPFPDEPNHPMNAQATHWVEEATLVWGSIAPEAFTFKRLDAPSPMVDICIQWRDDPHPSKPYEAGRTVIECHGEQQGQQCLKHVTIELLRHPKINQHLGVHEQGIQYYATLLHELGHALGLEHANQPTSVMYHRSLQNRHLTPEDTAMLRRLYG
jgi:hypothetical protein